MHAINNTCLLKALRRQPVDATPVWVMRQAGRYLPEYRQIRKRAGDFLTLCQTPELACEVTLQPIKRFDLDAAILFSDILTIPDAMGLGLQVIESVGPVFSNPLTSLSELDNLPMPDPEDDLAYVMDAIRLVIDELDNSIPLIGFAGSPWTIACYMIEGGSSKDFAKIKTMLYQQPDKLAQLLDHLSTAISLYLNAQIQAGVQAVMIFDTWGSILSPSAYQSHSLHYLQKIVNNLKEQNNSVPVIIYAKGVGRWIEDIANIGCDAIGLDWTEDIGMARALVGNQVGLQGNLDPAVLRTDEPTIRQHVAHILERYGHGNGHVFNLGHGISPDINPDNMKILVDAVHELSIPYHV